MKLSKYSLENLKESIKNSFSYREVLIKLDIIPAGGNYQTLKKNILIHNLDISHFQHQAINKNKKFPHKHISFNDYVNSSISIQSYKAKNKLIREKIFNLICSSCNRTTWLDNPIPLELDHIDGNNNNYQLDNLRLLCPNCHALTSTYRGKNKSNKA